MPIFQPGGDNAGYRGPAKTLTIKALQDRQAALAASQEAAAANAPPITNMWQGAGALVNSLGDSMQQSRVANQEADARAQLAQIMTQIDPNQGASMQQIAAMQQLDPDFANKEYERAMKQRFDIANREDDQSFRAGESQAERDARIAEQDRLFGHQDTTAATLAGTQEAAAVSDDARAAEAAKKLAETQETAAVATDARGDQNAIDAAALETRKTQEKLAAENANIGPQAAERRAAALKAGLVEGTSDFQQFMLTGDIPAPQQINPADALMPGQAEVDKKFAPEFVDWDVSGGANAVKAITQVNKAIDILQSGAGASGFKAGAVDLAPEFISKLIQPDINIARDAIRETVQQTLRATLGAQFTEKEGAELMNRAFDINQGPEENIRRAKALLQQVQAIAANKAQMVEYFRKAGTLKGYAGPTMDTSALTKLFTEDNAPPADPGAGAGGGSADVDAILKGIP